MDEIVNIQEDLEDLEENKLSESSFKTLSDPTVILPHNGESDHFKNLNQTAFFKQDQSTSRSSKKEREIELNILPITHVTLNLNVVNKKTTSSFHWKHNFVRKKSNNSPTNSSNMQNGSVTRSSSVYSKHSKEFLNNPSQQSDYSDNNLSTPDFSKPKSITKSRDSSALSYHISDYKNFEHSRQSLTLQQQQQRQNSIYFRQTQQTPNRLMEATNRPLSYIDIIRSKSSTGESGSSVCSVESPGQQRIQRHNYSVAEFNKFKSKLLKNHSRNYYIYDNANLNNNNDGRLRSSYYQQPAPMFQFQPANIQQNLQKNSLNKEHISQIKSIYETIQRANNLKKQSSVEMRRMNYLNSIKNTHDVLSNSLSVTKLN